MKKIVLAVLVAMLAISCTKSKYTPEIPVNVVATVSVVAVPGQDLTVAVHYTSANTIRYYDDIVKIYTNDTFCCVTSFDPAVPDTTITYTYRGSAFYGHSYKAFVVREITPGQKDTIAITSGNQ